jgi:hypothetical protein
MKRIIIAVVAVFGVLTVSTDADAQSTAQTIERALLAAPARAREDASVISWNADYSHRTLKQGTSDLVCYDRSGNPGQPAFAVACTSLGNLDRIAQNRRFSAEGGDRAGIRAMVAAADANGTRVPPVYGSAWMDLGGDDQASARPHTTIAMPGATEASSGFPESRTAGGAFIMAAGSSEAHLMVPYIVAP